MQLAIIYVRNVFGNSVFSGFAPEGDDWESYGIRADDEGNPIRDQNGNTISFWEVKPFDPENQAHVESAVEYATSNGCQDREELEDYLVGELGIPHQLIDQQLTEWCD